MLNPISVILLCLSTVYGFLGFKVLLLDRTSPLNRLFAALDFFLILWSVASALYITAASEAACIFWYQCSCIGFNTFIGIALHFFLVYSKQDKLLAKRWLLPALYIPAVTVSVMEVVFNTYAQSFTLGAYGWIVNAKVSSIWFWVCIAYPVLYIGATVALCLNFRKRAATRREARQATVILYTAAISLCIGLVMMLLFSILPSQAPDATPLAAILWMSGIYYSIVKFKLMTMTPELVAENLFQTILDSVILTDPDGTIIKVNPEAEAMLGYTAEELTGKPLEDIFYSQSSSGRNSITSLLRACPVRGVEAVMLSKSGAKIPAMLSISEYTDRYITRIGYVLASKDISEFKLAKEKIQYLATHDSLTGLPNRLLFIQLLSHSIQTAKRDQRKLAVFFIDLDRFKIINDTKGHDAGDQFLKEIASRYQGLLRAADVVCRQGGDEFVLMIENVAKRADLDIIANALLSATYQPVVLHDEECRVTASIGISIYPDDGEDEQTLMKNADTAMYYAKAEGKNNYRFFASDIQVQTDERMGIEKNLRFALERKELSLHYQAKVDVKTGAVTGVEALLRWNSPVLGSVPPLQFIPIAEETGMILPIGNWVLQTACAQNVAWQKQGLPAICMAVNLSLRQVLDNQLIAHIKAVLRETGMAPELLELEITESMIMSNPGHIITILTEIKRIGVKLSIDDFGTGYSSLSKLKEFPVDTLKIDRSFIHNLPENAQDKAITQAILVMGESLSLNVIAEGVETEAQLNYLKEQFCHGMQGFYFNKPMEPERFAAFLREQPPFPTQGAEP